MRLIESYQPIKWWFPSQAEREIEIGLNKKKVSKTVALNTCCTLMSAH